MRLLATWANQDMEVQKASNLELNPVREDRNIKKIIDSSQVVDTLKTVAQKGTVGLEYSSVQAHVSRAVETR